MDRHTAILVLLAVWAVGMAFQIPSLMRTLKGIGVRSILGCLWRPVAIGWVVALVIGGAILFALNPMNDALPVLCVRFALSEAFILGAVTSSAIAKRHGLGVLQTVACIVAPAYVLGPLVSGGNGQMEQ